MIQIDSLESYLRQSEREELRLSRHHWSAVANATNKKLTDQLNETYKYNPEYIYTETERQVIIDYFCKELVKRLNDKSFLHLRYIYTYIKSNYNTSETGRLLGVSQKQVHKHLQKIKYHAFKLLKEMNLSIEDFQEYLLPEISNYISGSVSNVGYPFEHFMNIPKQGAWQGRDGRIRGSLSKYKSCLIPEYLQDCNLCHTQCIICTDTNNCRRKDAFPDNNRTEVLKRSKDKITAIADNITANTPAPAYDGLERIYSFS